MNIPLSSPDITEKEIEHIVSVLKTPDLSLGPKLIEFENMFAKYIGTDFAIAVNSGTSALHMIVRTLGIKDGDEVITTPFSFISSANCLLFERAKPVFVDIDKETLNFDVARIKKAINKKTKAILAVDIFGYPVEWDEVKKIANQHNLILIEDSCEALGAEYKGEKAGTFGIAGAFAFYPNKQMTTGEGGMVVTNDNELADICKSIRNQGRGKSAEWLQHERLGYNYRLSDINSALGIAQLGRIKEILAKREMVANLYNSKLADFTDINLPFVLPYIKRSWFVYVIVLNSKFTYEQRGRVIDEMRKRGIGCGKYFSPIHLQPFYVKMFGYKKGDFPITESISQHTIALPFYNNLKESDIDLVVYNLKDVIASL